MKKTCKMYNECTHIGLVPLEKHSNNIFEHFYVKLFSYCLKGLLYISASKSPRTGSPTSSTAAPMSVQ